MIGDLGVAFVAGLLSCASACVLPLVPAYVAYLAGLASPDAGGPGTRRAALGAAGLFVAGFGTTFTALGAAAGVVGGGLTAYRPALVIASGAALVVLGIALLGSLPWLGRVPWLARERRLHVAHRLPRTPLAAYVVGVAFAAGWTPCVGPVLAAILLLAADASTAARGAGLLAAYSAGLGLPFLAAAAFVGPAAALLARLRGARPALGAAAAVLFIAMGGLTLSNRLTVVNGLFPDLGVGTRAAMLSGPAPGRPGGGGEGG
jgi:cytochrome c-type biogenesis protein